MYSELKAGKFKESYQLKEFYFSWSFVLFLEKDAVDEVADCLEDFKSALYS